MRRCHQPSYVSQGYASWLLQRGFKLSEVAKLMGHSSSRVTERYAHIAKISTKEIDKAMFDPRRGA